MSIKLKLFLGFSYLLILFVFLYYVFSIIEINRLNDFSYYKELQLNIGSFVGNNLYINLLFFFVFSIIWVSLLGFGSPILIISGIFFGKWIGTFISVFSFSIGALILYSITNFFFKDLIKSVFQKKFSKYINLFQKNEFFYFFIFRFIGGLGIPFGLQNVLPVIFNIKKLNYFFASLLGFVPNFFIWNTIGSGISDFIKQSDNFSLLALILTKEIYQPLLMFLILILISLLIKKKIFNARHK